MGNQNNKEKNNFPEEVKKLPKAVLGIKVLAVLNIIAGIIFLPFIPAFLIGIILILIGIKLFSLDNNVRITAIVFSIVYLVLFAGVIWSVFTTDYTGYSSGLIGLRDAFLILMSLPAIVSLVNIIFLTNSNVKKYFDKTRNNKNDEIANNSIQQSNNQQQNNSSEEINNNQKTNLQRSNHKKWGIINGVLAVVVLVSLIFVGIRIWYKFVNPTVLNTPANKIVEKYNHTQATNIKLTNEWKTCQQDSDCVETQESCCSCNGGGKQVAINKKHLDQWKNILKSRCNVGCPGVFVCQKGRPVCKNNKCEFEYNKETTKEPLATETELIEIAKQYVLSKPKLYYNKAKFIDWNNLNELDSEFSKVTPQWIISHKPKIRYIKPNTYNSNSPYKDLNGKYLVSWFFIPGCEENPNGKTLPNWYNKEGGQCLGGYILTVTIKPDKTIERAELDGLRK